MKKEDIMKIENIDYEKIIEMFGLDADEEIYFNCKGTVKAEDVVIEEDYTWSEAAGMLYGSELECYTITKEGIELTEEEYENITLAYVDKTECYDESGEKYGTNKSNEYANYGTNLSGSMVYILYGNYNNNNLVSYSIDVYEIE